MGRPSGPTRDTKLLICERALEVFAAKGYAAATMRDVAAAAGMRDASLYSHYPSKQAIFDAAVDHQLDRLTRALRSRGALAHPGDDARAYLTADPERLLPAVLASYEPLFADEQIVALRHVLESARHADPRCDELYRTVFVERPLELQREIFGRLVEAGLFSPCDLDLAARQFHGPVFLALCEDAPWGEAQDLVGRLLPAFLDQHLSKEVP